jgi:hypothetical protein
MKILRIVIIIFATISVPLFFTPGDLVAQDNRLTYPELLTALNAKLPAGMTKQRLIANLITDIRRRKVDKPLTPDIESLIRQAGGPQSLIDEIRRNSPVEQAAFITLITNVPGATITLENYGTFVDSIRELKVLPGAYRVDVQKQGYAPIARVESISTGERKIVRIDLEPIRINDLLVMAKARLDAHDFSGVRQVCDQILQVEPDNAQAHLYLGEAAHASRDWASATNHLSRAVTLGATARIVVARRRAFLTDESLQFGILVVTRNTLSFVNAKSIVPVRLGGGETDFDVPYSNISMLKTENYFNGYTNAWRIAMKINIPKRNGKFDRKDFDFYSASARVYVFTPRGAKYNASRIRCDNCAEEIQFVYEMIQRLQNPSSGPTLNRRIPVP